MAEDVRMDAPDVGQYATPDLFDLDGDGDLDLIIGNSGGEIRFYQNTGSNISPIWTRNKTAEIRTGSQYTTPRVVDLNGDLLPDLLAGTRFDAVKAYQNTGSVGSPVWSYRAEWNGPSVGEKTTVAVADLDLDGDFDLVLSNRFGDVIGYMNAGSAQQPQWQLKTSGVSARWRATVLPVSFSWLPGLLLLLLLRRRLPPPPPVATQQMDVQSMRIIFHYHDVLSPDTYGPNE